MANVRLLKLVNGEEILCDVVKAPAEKSGEGYYQVKNPVRMVLTGMDKEGKPGVGMLDWSPFAAAKKGDTFTLKESHVIVSLTPLDQFAQFFQQQFGGIVVPTGGPTSGLIFPGSK